MDTKTLQQTIAVLDTALNHIRADLAACGDTDRELRFDEICVEVAQSRYSKRLKNLRELEARHQLEAKTCST